MIVVDDAMMAILHESRRLSYTMTIAVNARVTVAVVAGSSGVIADYIGVIDFGIGSGIGFVGSWESVPTSVYSDQFCHTTCCN